MGHRFPQGTEEVEIYLEAEALILKLPSQTEWPAEFWRAFDGMPEGFDRPAPVPQERDCETTFDAGVAPSATSTA